MASNARVVCWSNREEWTQTYEYLYSFHDISLQRRGIARVLAWKSRSGGKLPLAVESTANLISALLESQTAQYSYSSQMTISMALVRFVNGFTDKSQKGVYARSVQSIADEIGLPDWLVDLRHESTHAAKLPSQQTLCAGVKVALDWLEEGYWKAQM
ncbi:predicted protein, partial [Nematostella vectensis]